MFLLCEMWLCRRWLSKSFSIPTNNPWTSGRVGRVNLTETTVAMLKTSVKHLFLLIIFLSLVIQWRFVKKSFIEGQIYVEVKGPQWPTTKLKNTSAVWNKTALVFSARYLTNCSAARLHQLAATTPPEVDVWFLHDHAKYNPSSPEIVTSLYHLNSLVESVRVQHAAKESTMIPGFDTAKSGASKSSFLRWMKKHGKEYEYAWHVEEDIFYTGMWSTMFRAHELETADVIAIKIPAGKPWRWAQRRHCRINYPSEMHQRMNCNDIIRFACHWAILRFSQSFSTRLLEDLEKKRLYGHHEAVIGILLTLEPDNFTYSALQHVGKIVAPGKARGKVSLGTLTKNVTPNRLYHPIKCQAYQTDLTPLLQQMVFEDI